MGVYMNNYSLKRFIFLFMNFDYKCSFCGSVEDLQCHHIVIYERGCGRGNYNRYKDLLKNYLIIRLLCSKCHLELHNLWELMDWDF